MYVAGTQANVIVPLPLNLAALMAATPNPPANIGPQYPWPYEGSAPSQLHVSPPNTPVNPASVQRTTFRVIGQNDINVYFLDERFLNFLTTWLRLFPAQALAGPTAGFWPLPIPVPLFAVVGNYTFEIKWRWLLYQRAVALADVDLDVYMWG